MINHLLKTLITFALLLVTSIAYSQVNQELLLGTGNKAYGVDLAELPDGTPGSTYEWTVTPSTNVSFPPGIGENIITNDNKATINWSQAPEGEYEIKVVEKNLTCSDEQTFRVKIISPKTDITVTPPTEKICAGSSTSFQISDALAGSILHYTVTNGTPTEGNITIDASGKASINLTHDGSENSLILTINSIEINGRTYLLTITETIEINIVKTSEITPLD